MDVAGFAGFAEKGPLHVPVCIEEVSEFQDIFGNDVALAWDNEQKRMQYSLLGATVEAFFRNGGRRCWVVRVARDESDDDFEAAQTMRFYPPGLYSIESNVAVEAEAVARCAGSWADNIRAGTRLVSHVLTPNRVATTSPTAGVFDHNGDQYILRVHSTPTDLQAGDLIECRWGDAGLRVYLFIDDIGSSAFGLTLRAQQGYWFLDTAFASPADDVLLPEYIDETTGLAYYESIVASDPEQMPAIRRLLFDLLVWDNGVLQGQVSGLAFHPDHPRFWGNLPDDERLFGRLLAINPVNLDPGLLQMLEDVTNPRFPLAASFDDVSTSWFLPLAMTSETDSGSAAYSFDRVEPEFAAPDYIRNGLQSFSADYFVDRDLAGITTFNLINEAEHKRVVQRQQLKGLHSLLFIDEVSMIAAPDALHRHWDLDPPVFEEGLAAPQLDVPDETEYAGIYELHWDRVEGQRRYIVQQSLSSEFEEVIEYTVELPGLLELDESVSPVDPAVTLKLDLRTDCLRTYFFRLRAEGNGGFSPWSNSRAVRVPDVVFLDCSDADVSLLNLTLELSSIEAATETITLTWHAEDPASPSQVDLLADAYELERALDADFISAETIYPLEGEPVDELQKEVLLQSDQVAYFRVRAKHSNLAGPWSNTIVVNPLTLAQQTLNEVDEFDASDMLAVNTALIRLCAARADTLAVLSLPEHYRHIDILSVLDTLLPLAEESEPTSAVLGSGSISVPLLNNSEQSALSYAAVYSPWLRTAQHRDDRSLETGNAIRLIPPPGAVCGKLAVTALQRGAWLAAANKTLQDVLGLSYQSPEASLVELAQKQVNSVREVPSGFVVATAVTLSLTREFKPLNVRRLFMLLRRIITREGANYTFEPNSIDFRNRVQHYWERLLGDLYRRGALRGKNAGEAFRVITDESVNDSRSMDLGRFIVELRVAPAQPLSFINVRLIQTGPDQLLLQEL